MNRSRTIELDDLDLISAPVDPQTIGVATSLEPSRVVQLTQSIGLRHVVQRGGIEYEKELNTAEVMIEKPDEFFIRPIDVILGSSVNAMGSSMGVVVGALPGIKTLYVASSAQEKKNKTLQELESFLDEVRGARAIRDQALMIADELYTNGAKNAWPLGSDANDKDLRPGRVEFLAGCDGSRLVLSCRDSFGELDFERVLSRISNCYENGVAKSINHGRGGAGIGSFMVFESCISYYIGVEKGLRSVVCVVLPLGLSLRQQAALPKNIHILSVA